MWAVFKARRLEDEFRRVQHQIAREARSAAKRDGRKWPLSEKEIDRIVYEARRS
jgi:AMMECR1 domain-containing protein